MRQDTLDLLDKVILNELKISLLSILEDPYSLYHDLERAYSLADSFLDVISWFSTTKEYNDFVATLPEREVIQIDKVTDNEDGSALVEFSTTQEQMKVLAGEGLKYLLMKQAAPNNMTDDEIFAKIVK